MARERAPVLFCACSETEDRKSTRLNSSHVANSYAVFCLKKKNHVIAGRSVRFDFQHSLDASSHGGDGTWINIDSPDFPTSNTGAAPGNLDGNASASLITI